MIRTSEILTSKSHIEPLRDDGYVIYKLGWITPVSSGKREAKMLWGNVKGANGVTPHIGENGHWYIGATDTGIAATGPAGTAGDDGREIELSISGGYIVWRYVGDVSWTNLILLSSLKGDKGDTGENGAAGADGSDGREIELSTSGGYVVWRYVGDVAWNNLVLLSSLKGDKGDAGDPGAAGRGITSVTLVSTVGKVKTYRITFTDATTFDFEVTDGADGAGGGGGASDEIVEVYIDFVDSLPFTYTCPVALRFTSMEYEGNAPTLSVALNTEMAQYQDIVITPNGAGLVILKGAIASVFSFDVYIDFAIAGSETYKCPYALKFTAMDHEQANAPTLSIALNTNTTKYQVQTVTADAPGLVTLKATILEG